MKKKDPTMLAIAVAATSLLAGGCATSKQARSVEPDSEGFLLGDYSMLREGKGGEALKTYKNESANWASYTKLLIDPVKFEKPEKASEDDLKDLQKLADDAAARIREQLGQDFELVAEPGSHTLHLQALIVDAHKKKVARNLLSSVLPIGAVLSVGKDFITGKPLGVGEITAEMKMTDASTGELLAAAVDKRVGQKYSKGQLDSWADAESAVDYWAKRLRFALCQLRGTGGCVEP